MDSHASGLGKEYASGDIICAQGGASDCMYVIQSGQAVVTREEGGRSIEVGRLSKGDIFGEMAVIERQPRSATVRAEGNVRVLTLDKRAFLRRVYEDPFLAFRILQQMCHRIRLLDEEVVRLRRAVES